ncbi:ABC-2 type transport system ATP-binding protein [Lachnospiraceae bacterium PF1-22]|uniref:ABC transporter ATP-binding protein n=1 Tax=Ohessyouella blattaphilus TaxID=2949333 RepID=UPI003E1F8811
MENGMIVQTKGLVRVFDEREIIRNCNINVREGSIYGFLGANGAGKTTVFKMLTGLLIPTAGKVSVMGMDIVAQRDRILRQIGSLIEVPIFYDHLTAVSNLEIHLAYMKTQGMGIATALKMVGLDPSNKHPVSRYSLGMRQRLGIARAIVHKPKVLILDEPINGLDPMGIREMRELFLTLVHKEGMTLMLSSHILSEIEHIADTIGVIVNGEIVEEAELGSIREKYPDGLEDYFFKMMRGGREND